jgi:hypothetical protein
LVQRPALRFLRRVSANEDFAPLLAVILLHEVGHIIDGDAGRYSPADEVDWDSVNNEDSISKSRELQADAFAAGAIKRQLLLRPPPPAANRLREALTRASVERGRERPVAPFGQFPVSPTRLYWDAGYSHPNFDLRLLIMLNMIDENEQSRRKLSDFVSLRRRAGRARLFLPTRGSKQRPYYSLPRQEGQEREDKAESEKSGKRAPSKVPAADSEPAP